MINAGICFLDKHGCTHTCVAVLLIAALPVFSPDVMASADTPWIRSLVNYENNILDSGGTLLEEQAAYNVLYYDMDLFVDPGDSTIHGSVITRILLHDDIDTYVVHLDSVFTTHRVMWIRTEQQSVPLEFIHQEGLVIASFPDTMAAGNVLDLEITYSGRPRIAPNPPWDGGFTWGQTDAGDPWIGVSCQMNGADLWWPVKDHPSDRPDSVTIKLTVPAGLKAVSNGVLVSVEQYSEDTMTYHWKTRNPINNYAVTMNIGPYEKLRRTYQSINGEDFPVYFWALPENRDKAEELMGQIKQHMRYFEDFLGPYPFRNEKYGVVETPFLGMEHQTLVAYGAGYRDDVVFESGSGFDDLHHHELAHEWWGNLLSVCDWKDFWIHEGFATYMQALYAEQLHGRDHYLHFMELLHRRISNNMAIAPEDARTAGEMMDGRDVYMKGAWVLHTLRYLIGDELFFQSMRRMTYRDPEMEGAGMDPPSRFTGTNDFIDHVRSITGRNLDWFFETYLRHAELPALVKEWRENDLFLDWESPTGNPFPMPVEIFNGSETITMIPDGKTSVTIDDMETFRIDPGIGILRQGMFR